ncbi:hypothetical protein QJS04_geneDACA013301 [Acorus gramineus]|uniref:Methylenetetrahydrofolate reductase n=1 Tax=Acorus gramineus TaxID=55184 RepID=A0AAV9BB61_ACOGR|nr:hypothetical protein QJS04_geneDACA013301 [Acorus gramineus]
MRASRTSLRGWSGWSPTAPPSATSPGALETSPPDLTLDITNRMQNMVCVETMMHLTCTNMPVEKIDHALDTIKANGIQNVLALRGDPPHGQDKFVQVAGGFACALDLVQHIRAKHGDYFGITVAGYPGEEGVSLEGYNNDLADLKRKVDAGADVIVTQLFYDTGIFLKFVNDCRQIGITCPIVPGLMPINNYKGFLRMTGFCKTKSIPISHASLASYTHINKPNKGVGFSSERETLNRVKDDVGEVEGIGSSGGWWVIVADVGR